MKQINVILLAIGLFMASSLTAHANDIMEVVNKGLERSLNQSLRMAKALENDADKLPRTYDGQFYTCDYKNWVSGFFPGLLWYLYEENRTAELEYFARLYTARVEPAKRLRSTHDLGFMINCSFGNGYRLTGDPHYLEVMKEGAQSLATRFDPQIGLIKSWGTRDKWQYPVIIDNMMNLEFLMDVGRLAGISRYSDMANSHAQKTMKNHFRDDFSCYHVVSYDTLTALPHAKNTHQGLADESAWARGQAWALYGFTMMYRETGNEVYLQQARRVGNYICNHPRLPEDKIPYWDFDDPKIPDTYRDASTGAVMASAFIELSQLDNSADAKRWLDMGERQVRSLTSDAYMAKEGTNGNFVLKHSVGNLNKNSEVDTPLTYADYYYVEALLRLKRIYQGKTDRRQWVEWMLKIASPVIRNLAAGTLHQQMPYESLDKGNRRHVSYLEAFGRTMVGLAPWLELGADDTDEGRLRAEYLTLTRQALKNAVDPLSSDRLDFSSDKPKQPLVDAAFLCEGLLHARHQLLDSMDTKTRKDLIDALKSSRRLKPNETNWLLFASTIEALLLEITGECDSTRLRRGIDQFMRAGWYKGDAVYGDGMEVHLDYYNSLVIHPLLTDVLTVMVKHGMIDDKYLKQQKKRQKRLGLVLERFISPEGTYPVLGRSITYRFGHFHGLSHAALAGLLPQQLTAGQVRTALTAVINRQINSPGTFDRNGWLSIGFAGHQPQMSEAYINTGSEYMCMAVFMTLGLPESDAFWTEPYQTWSALKAWHGIDIGADHALRDSGFQ